MSSITDSTGSHPRGLYVLFFTEMWERFSYYGMRALLVLYLVNSLEFPRERALEVYATYTALVYLTPLIGGYIADRWLGSRRAVLVGAMVMAMGHFTMAIPSLLYPALGLLVAGNGFFKPNISTLVGSLYERGDKRRDSGFTVFYMGINLGAFLAPLVCGSLGEKVGWHYGFAAAGVGMLAGLLVFVAGQSRLLGISGAAGVTGRDWTVAVATSLGVVALVAGVVGVWPRVVLWWDELGTAVQIGVGVALVTGALVVPRVLSNLRVPLAFGRRATVGAAVAGRSRLTREERHRIAAILIIAVFVVFFWMGFEQAGGTMNLFADQRTDRMLLGWEMPASYFQAVNPLLILLLAPFFSMLWSRVDRSRLALSSAAKQGLGMIILGFGFMVLAIADARADVVGKVSLLWLLAVYLLHTTGELCLSPIGLSMVTRLAPAQMVAMMMGVWFLAMALASYLAGTLESLLEGSGIPLYWFLVGSSVGAGVLLLLLSPLIKRLMHGTE